MIDFSLIAGTVYSYSISNCEILLKNQYTQKETKTQFLEPSQEFTIICEICSKNVEKSHLCVNSHVACDYCIKNCVKCKKDVCIQCTNELNSCYICKEGLCSDCSKKCEFCDEMTCQKHLMECSHCSETTCFFCSDSCEYCNKKSCVESIIACQTCKKRTCSNDSEKCFECKKEFCPNDRQICAICEQIHCTLDSKKCEFCEQKYSANCIKSKLCQSCSKLSEVSKENNLVQKAILANPELRKYKKWEVSENSRFCIFKAKKMLGSKIIIYDKDQSKIVLDKKGGWR